MSDVRSKSVEHLLFVLDGYPHEHRTHRRKFAGVRLAVLLAHFAVDVPALVGCRCDLR